MVKGTSINISPYTRDVIKGLKKKRSHKNYDSALREIFMRADLDEEELIQLAREESNFDPEKYYD